MSERIPNTSLRRARMQSELTQEDVAEALQVSLMAVYRWEQGLRIPSEYHRQRLCALFDHTEQELGWISPTEDDEVVPPSWFLVDPALPQRRPVMGQSEVLKAMQAACLVATPAQRIGVVGLPGSGKTALVGALLSLPKIQQQFAGILWATVGQHSSPRLHWARWAQVLGMDPLPADRAQAQECFRTAIGSQSMLVVLDDLWNGEDLASHAIGEVPCQYLVTTRRPALAHALCERVFRPATLTTQQAVSLLSRALAARSSYSFRAGLHTAVAAVGHLPGALEAAKRYLAQEASSASPRRIDAALRRLAHPACYLQMPGEDSLFAAIQRSERWLPTSTRQGLRSLAARLSAAPATFSEQQALEILPASDLDRLLDAGLLEGVSENRYQLHPVISLYARLENAPGGEGAREPFLLLHESSSRYEGA